jgi:hypothetical protein
MHTFFGNRLELRPTAAFGVFQKTRITRYVLGFASSRHCADLEPNRRKPLVSGGLRANSWSIKDWSTTSIDRLAFASTFGRYLLDEDKVFDWTENRFDRGKRVGVQFGVYEHCGALSGPSSIAISDEFSGIVHSRIIMEDSAKVAHNGVPQSARRSDDPFEYRSSLGRILKPILDPSCVGELPGQRRCNPCVIERHNPFYDEQIKGSGGAEIIPYRELIDRYWDRNVRHDQYLKLRVCGTPHSPPSPNRLQQFSLAYREPYRFNERVGVAKSQRSPPRAVAHKPADTLHRIPFTVGQPLHAASENRFCHQFDLRGPR